MEDTRDGLRNPLLFGGKEEVEAILQARVLKPGIAVRNDAEPGVGA